VNSRESTRNKHKVRRLLLAIHALAHWLWRYRIPLLPRLLTLFNRVVFAAQVPAGTHIGKGTRLY